MLVGGRCVTVPQRDHIAPCTLLGERLLRRSAAVAESWTPSTVGRVFLSQCLHHRSAQETLQCRQASNEDTYAALDNAPESQSNRIRPIFSNDLSEADDGGGNDNEGDAKDAGQTNLLSLVDMKLWQKMEGQQHNHNVR